MEHADLHRRLINIITIITYVRFDLLKKKIKIHKKQTFSFLFQFFVITIFTLENMHKIVVSLMLSLCTHVGSDVSHSG